VCSHCNSSAPLHARSGQRPGQITRGPQALLGGSVRLAPGPCVAPPPASRSARRRATRTIVHSLRDASPVLARIHGRRQSVRALGVQCCWPGGVQRR
jgi:hypothetical protein